MRVIDDLNKDWLFKKNIEVTDKLIIDESFDIINVPGSLTVCLPK